MDKQSKNSTFIFHQSYLRYWQSLSKLYWLILIMVVCKDINLLWADLISNKIINVIIYAIQALFLIYFACVCLLVIYHDIDKQQVDYHRAFRHVFNKLIKIYLVTFVYCAFLFLLTRLYQQLLLWFPPPNETQLFWTSLIILLLFSFSIFAFYLRYFFVIPLILFKKISLLKTWSHSVDLVQDNLIKTFSAYAAVVLVFALSGQQTYHASFFRKYDVSALFDYVFWCAVVPLICNFIVYLFRELEAKYLEVQHEIEEE